MKIDSHIGVLARPLAFLAIVLSMFGSATAVAQQKDKKGSADHPMISRYPGSYIDSYRQLDFEESALAVGVRNPKEPQTVILQPYTGKVTSIVYKVAGGQSVVQVFRNFEQAVQKAGLKTLFTCAEESCGGRFGPALFEKSSRAAIYHSMNYLGIKPGNGDLRYLSASGTYNGKPVAIGIYVTRLDHLDRTNIGIEIIESAEMESGLISINTESLRNDLDRTGKAVLTGVYFDTDKATLKSDSAAALQVIADYLKASKGSFFVVGHTDTQGAYDHNVNLSRSRAMAVVEELKRKYGIAADRLTAIGVGPVSPAASNQKEEDRALNRRVELVLR